MQIFKKQEPVKIHDHFKKVQQKRRKLTKAKAPMSKRRRMLWKGILFLSVLVLLTVLLSVISFLNILQIQKITVKGGDTLLNLRIENEMYHELEHPFFWLFSRRNIVTVDVDDLHNNLYQAFPRINTIKIKKHLFSRELSVSIIERIPYALWCPQREVLREDCFYIDPAGYIFARVGVNDDTSGKVIFYEGIGESTTDAIRKRIAESTFKKINEINKDLRKKGLHPSRVSVMDGNTQIEMQPNWILKIDTNDDTARIADDLMVVLTQKKLLNALDTLEYIDMRFGRRVYVKRAGIE